MLVDITCGAEFLDTYLFKAFGFGEGLEKVEVDGLVLNSGQALETEFGQTALEGHLTAFETDFAAVA